MRVLGDGGLLSLCRVAMDTELEEQDQLAHSDAHTETCELDRYNG